MADPLKLQAEARRLLVEAEDHLGDCVASAIAGSFLAGGALAFSSKLLGVLALLLYALACAAGAIACRRKLQADAAHWAAFDATTNYPNEETQR